LQDGSTEPAQGKPGKAEGSSMDAFMEMLLVKKGSGNLNSRQVSSLDKIGKIIERSSPKRFYKYLTYSRRILGESALSSKQKTPWFHSP
jgi:hypothetical protein